MRVIRRREEFWKWQIRKLTHGGMQKASGFTSADFYGYLEPLKNDFLNGDGDKDMIVIPPSFVSLPAKMRMVKVGRNKGYCYLNPGGLKEQKTPNSPYLVLDVENGKKMLGVTPLDCLKVFEEEKRFGFIANEGVMLVYYWPATIREHFIDLPGSRYGDDVAFLWLVGGGPGLVWGWADGSVAGWGSASCGSRIGPRRLAT